MVEVLLCNNTVIEALDIHHANRIICFSVDGNMISSDNINGFFFKCSVNDLSLTAQQALYNQIHLIAAVVRAEAPVVEKRISIKERIHFPHTVFHMTFSKIPTMCIRQLCDKPTFHPIHRTGAVVILRIILYSGDFHTLDSMYFSLANNFHDGVFRAFSGWHIIKSPCQLFTITRNQQPSLQFLPFN